MIIPLLKVAVAFAAGASATFWLGDLIGRPRSPSPVDEARLRERVRARLADLVSRPDAIEVGVDGGIVRVSGRVLATELDELLLQLTDMPGVYKVHNALTAIDDPARFDQAPASDPSTPPRSDRALL